MHLQHVHFPIIFYVSFACENVRVVNTMDPELDDFFEENYFQQLELGFLLGLFINCHMEYGGGALFLFQILSSDIVLPFDTTPIRRKQIMNGFSNPFLGIKNKGTLR